MRLAGRLYLPDGDGPFAALLEALPYRKDDVTASYRETYARYVDAGFAVLRLDLRGTGSSGGMVTDEYPDVERRDLRRAIEWLAAQPWSTGRVGMFGTSYSGFNSLQMAAEGGAAALGAVVAMYATDDRYTDDVHYCGGVLRAIDLIDYPLYMVAMNALPPVPAVVRRRLARRVAAPGRRDAAVAARVADASARRPDVAARLDPPRPRRRRLRADGVPDDARRRVGRRLPQQHVPRDRAVRAQRPAVAADRRTVGAHRSPERARPGPNVDDDREIIAFFDEHLRGGPTAQRRAGPGVRPPRRSQPQPDLVDPPRRVARPRRRGRRPGCASATWTVRRRSASTALEVRGDVGVAAWNSCAGALPWGQPLDQRDDNARSLVYDWPVADRGEVLGTAVGLDCGCAATGRTATSASSSATCSPTARRR